MEFSAHCRVGGTTQNAVSDYVSGFQSLHSFHSVQRAAGYGSLNSPDDGSPKNITEIPSGESRV